MSSEDRTKLEFKVGQTRKPVCGNESGLGRIGTPLCAIDKWNCILLP